MLLFEICCSTVLYCSRPCRLSFWLLKPLYFQDVTVLHVCTPVPSQSKALYRTTQNQFGPMKDDNCCLLGLL